MKLVYTQRQNGNITAKTPYNNRLVATADL